MSDKHTCAEGPRLAPPGSCDGCDAQRTYNEARAFKGIEKLGDAWPFPRVSYARSAHEFHWFETNEEHYWHFLEVLPPIYFRGGFFVSEPADHDERDVPIYSALAKVGERYFIREVAKDKADEAMRELHAALAAEVAA